jgi:hypothetical protein
MKPVENAKQEKSYNLWQVRPDEYRRQIAMIFKNSFVELTFFK